MKKSLLIVAVGVLFAGSALCQSIQEEVDYLQSIFGMGKKAMVAQFINSEGTGMEAFWVLYDEYEVSRKQLGQERLMLLYVYANEYGQMNDEELGTLMKAIMKHKKSLDKLIDKYYKKIVKSSGTVAAAQFYQIENYILSGIRVAILDDIPFIGELEF